jgi:hypothetical protein
MSRPCISRSRRSLLTTILLSYQRVVTEHGTNEKISETNSHELLRVTILSDTHNTKISRFSKHAAAALAVTHTGLQSRTYQHVYIQTKDTRWQIIQKISSMVVY